MPDTQPPAWAMEAEKEIVALIAACFAHLKRDNDYTPPVGSIARIVAKAYPHVDLSHLVAAVPGRSYVPKLFSVITHTHSDTVDLKSGDYSKVSEDRDGGIKPLFCGDYDSAAAYMRDVMVARDVLPKTISTRAAAEKARTA